MMEFSEMINVFFSRWKDQVVWDKGPNGGEDPNKIHILNDSVVRSDAFAEFKERLYQAPVVKTMKIIKLV
jgi:hypothetical protein